jgi:hypothetical protein
MRKPLISPEQKIGFKIGRYIIEAIIVIVIIMSACTLINQPDTLMFFGGVAILIALLVYYIPKAIRFFKNVNKSLTDELEEEETDEKKQ